MKQTKHTVFAAGLITFASLGTATATITTSGNFQTGTPTPTLTNASQFYIVISVTGSVSFLVFQGWVVNDGTKDTVSTNPASQNFSYLNSFNPGAPVLTAPILSFTDNSAAFFGAISPNDGYLTFATPFPVTAGQYLSIPYQSFTFDSTPNFHPASAFNRTVFVADASGTQLSDRSTLPEPSTMAFGTIAAFLALARRPRTEPRVQPK